VLGRPAANVWTQPKIRDMRGYKPIRSLGWALKKLETAQGEQYYILKNLREGTYLRLNEQQAYQWNLMDGSQSVQDIVVSCFLTFQTLSIDSLMGFLDQLQSKGFLTSKSVNAYQAANSQLERRSLANWGRRLVMLLVDSEFAIKSVDPFYTALYRSFGWILYTPPVQILILLVTLAGVPAFFYMATHGNLSLLTGAGNALGVGLVFLIIAEIFSIFSHESAHALTVKRYKRQVRRGGMGLYFGTPTFFMDTTDIWMEPRGPRLAVTWAGPYSGFFLGGLASLLLLVSRSSVWSGLLYQFATFCYLISFTNLNPLLKLDGYYLLMDWLEMPMLRERSMDFVQGKLWVNLHTRQKFTHEERIFAVFGVLAIIWTAIAIYSMVDLYGGAIFGFIAKIVGPLAAWIIIIVLIGTVAGLFLRSWWMTRSKAQPIENTGD
jgi:putative peptide zinc metalloprotease protein